MSEPFDQIADNTPEKENATVVDEVGAKGKKRVIPKHVPDKERDMLEAVALRFDAMDAKKRELGIDDRCLRFDRIYTPHELGEIALSDRKFSSDAVTATMNLDEDEDRKARNSKPAAYEKVQTALGLLIRSNPKAWMEEASKKWGSLNEVIKQTLYKNLEKNRTNLEWKRFTFHLAKYGLAFGRRHYKRVYKIEHRSVWNKKLKKEVREKVRVAEVDDAVFEAVHPRHVWMDENARNARHARDCFFIYQLRESELDDLFPESLFPKIKDAKASSNRWLLQADIVKSLDQSAQPGTSGHEDKLFEVAIYENKAKDVLLRVVNGRMIDEVDNELPGHQLSLIHEKWSERDESYDGIGVCHIFEIYSPLIDEINTSSIDLVRARLKPKMVMGNGVTISDESREDDDDRLGEMITVDGDPNQIKFIQPAPMTSGEFNMFERMLKEVDDGVGIARDLSALSGAETLGQASFNRENSLRRLNAPLEGIKEAMEDDANKAMPLFKWAYSVPIATYEIEDARELEDATRQLAFMRMHGVDDERFVRMRNGKIVRRKFREFKIPLRKGPNGDIVHSQTSFFWELVPENFSWQGYIHIIPMSFLPKSQAMEDMRTKERLTFMLNQPTIDQMTGKPTIVDENGQAYKINRKRLWADFLEQQSRDVDDYIIPFDPSQNTEADASGFQSPEGARVDGSRNGNANERTQQVRGLKREGRSEAGNERVSADAGLEQ